MISFDQFKYQKKCSLEIPTQILPNKIKQMQIAVPTSPIQKEIQVAIPTSPIQKEIQVAIPTSPIQKEIQVAVPIVESIQQNVSYIYLIREREHYMKDENVYKFGRCTQLPDHKINRLYHYKKGSEIVMVLQCKNVIDTENRIRVIFKQRFIQHIDGHEHYYGDVNMMKKIIWDVINT
jgi:hypothetical protein